MLLFDATVTLLYTYVYAHMFTYTRTFPLAPLLRNSYVTLIVVGKAVIKKNNTNKRNNKATLSSRLFIAFVILKSG